jgi:hypothetical protein
MNNTYQIFYNISTRIIKSVLGPIVIITNNGSSISLILNFINKIIVNYVKIPYLDPSRSMVSKFKGV